MTNFRDKQILEFLFLFKKKVIKNIIPVSTYSFRLGLIKTQSDNIEHFSYPMFTTDDWSARTSTCFDQPGPPENLKRIVNTDGTVLLAWDPPRIIRAPSLCYYMIKRHYSDNSEQWIETKDVNYIIDSNEKIESIRISAFNHAKCYSKFNSTSCVKYKLGSREEFFKNTIFVNVTDPTTLAPTTVSNSTSKQKSNGSSRLGIANLTVAAIFIGSLTVRKFFSCLIFEP